MIAYWKLCIDCSLAASEGPQEFHRELHWTVCNLYRTMMRSEIRTYEFNGRKVNLNYHSHCTHQALRDNVHKLLRGVHKFWDGYRVPQGAVTGRIEVFPCHIHTKATELDFLGDLSWCSKKTWLREIFAMMQKSLIVGWVLSFCSTTLHYGRGWEDLEQWYLCYMGWMPDIFHNKVVKLPPISTMHLQYSVAETCHMRI